MVNPQLENGYTSIANEILEKVVATRLPANEYRILLFIIRKTYGFHKKEDRISLTQFQKALGVSRPTVSKSLKNLITRNMVVRTPLLALKFNKHWDSWVVDTPLLVKNKNNTGKGGVTFTGKGGVTYKRNIKETNTKETPGASADIKEINQVLEVFYQRINPGINFGNKTNRKASDWLIKNYGFEKTKAMAEWACKIQGRQYAPIVTTPWQLKEKLGELKIYADKLKIHNKPRIITI